MFYLVSFMPWVSSFILSDKNVLHVRREGLIPTFYLLFITERRFYLSIYIFISVYSHYIGLQSEYFKTSSCLLVQENLNDA